MKLATTNTQRIDKVISRNFYFTIYEESPVTHVVNIYKVAGSIEMYEVSSI